MLIIIIIIEPIMTTLSESVPKKSNVKLNALREIEEKIQAKWESEKIFEENAPQTKM